MYSIIRFSIAFIFILSLCLINTLAQTENTALEVGKPIERELKGGETHSYRITLTAGQFLYAIADQRGIDAVASFYSPDGKKLFDVDSPNGSNGPEPVWAVAETAGDYRLEIRSLEKDVLNGRYEVSIKELRAGISDDKHFVAAQKELTEAANLIFGERTEESRTKAKQKFDNSVKLFRLIENKERRATSLAKTGRIVGSWLGRLEDEVALLLEALPIFDEIGKKSDAASALLDVGKIQTSDYKLKDATETYEQALALAKVADDKKLQTNIFIAMGTTFTLMGNYPQAFQHYQAALKLSEEISYKKNIAAAIGNIGIVYQEQGNYAKSLEYLLKDLSFQQEINPKNGVPPVLLNVGNIYYYQGNYDLALEYFQKALAGFEAMPSRNGIVYALDNIGSVYLNRGQYAEALTSFQKAQQTRRGELLKDPTSILNIGLIYKEQGKYAEALDYFEKAMPLAQRAEKKTFLVDILNGISDINLAKRDFPKALEIGQQAAKIAGDANYFDGYWLALIRLGTANLELGKLKEARTALELAAAQTEINRNQIAGGEEQQQRFFEDKALPYKALIGLSITEGKFNDAFSFAERTKSRTLLDVLQNGKVDFTKAISVQEQEKESSLKYELVSLNAQISKENGRKQADKTRLADLQNQLEKKRLEFEDFQIRLYAAYPGLKVQRGEMKPISLEEAGKLLPDNQSALLEYVVTDDKSFLFVLTKEAKQPAVSLKVYSIDIKQKDLAQKTESFRSKLAKGDLDFPQSARDLYNLLLKPAEAQIKNKTNLIIVPDASLWDLPFQALQPAQNRYLIETSAVSYAPSLTALREMTKKNQSKQTSSANLIAFGNPIVGKETSERIKQVFMGEKLSPLPEAERLVNSLKQMYGAGRSKIYIGADAKEEIAKTETSKYRILQFSAHGILNDVNPMYSHIVLSQSKDTDKEDGLLEAWEMKDLNLNADMVILSACETARGRFGSGEGVIGMSWALFIAGAPTTVVSQWKVESSSTTELMLEFHRQLLTGKGISKAEALKRASLKLLKNNQYKHPSYWAAFVIVGDGF